MTRWEDKEFDTEEKSAEEIHLLKKFQDYLNLEKNELEKRRSKYHSESSKIRKKQKITLALIEGSVLVGLTAVFVFLLSMQ